MHIHIYIHTHPYTYTHSLIYTLTHTLTHTPQAIEGHVPCGGYPTPGFVCARTGKVLIADAFDEDWTDGAALLQKVRGNM